jgi:hypothetical protein
MSFQDVALRRSRREPTSPRMRRNHPPKLQNPAARNAAAVTAFKENARPAGPSPLTRDRQLKPSRYLHDDLLRNYRLHLSKSRSSSSFLEAEPSASRGMQNVAVAAESRDDSESLGEDRLSLQGEQLRSFTPRSTFAKMTQETQQFQKLVADLEAMLKLAGESPETDWKARIMVRSAQETDQGLGEKLQVYENTLLLQNPNGLRTSQKTACLKLRRDFQRSHAALITCLADYEARQKAEVSQLGATRWTASSSTGGSRTMESDDFFERTMRQRELERMNNSMRQVNLIYHELAGLVDLQQEKVDRLDGDVDDAAAYTTAAANEIHCLHGKRETVLCGVMDGCVDDDENDVLLTQDKNRTERSGANSPLPKGLRVSEPFYWLMPFETIQEDLVSIKDDIVHVGKDIVSRGKRLKCSSSPRRRSSKM